MGSVYARRGCDPIDERLDSGVDTRALSEVGWGLLARARERKPHPPYEMMSVSRAPLYAFICPFCRTVDHSVSTSTPPVCYGGYPSRLSYAL